MKKMLMTLAVTSLVTLASSCTGPAGNILNAIGGANPGGAAVGGSTTGSASLSKTDYLNLVSCYYNKLPNGQGAAALKIVQPAINPFLMQPGTPIFQLCPRLPRISS